MSESTDNPSDAYLRVRNMPRRVTTPVRIALPHGFKPEKPSRTPILAASNHTIPHEQKYRQPVKCRRGVHPGGRAPAWRLRQDHRAAHQGPRHRGAQGRGPLAGGLRLVRAGAGRDYGRRQTDFKTCATAGNPPAVKRSPEGPSPGRATPCRRICARRGCLRCPAKPSSLPGQPSK